MADNTAEAADACLSLAYKYHTLRGCVKDQRPQLMSDPKLAMIDMQINILMQAFDARVKALAEGGADA